MGAVVLALSSVQSLGLGGHLLCDVTQREELGCVAVFPNEVPNSLQHTPQTRHLSPLAGVDQGWANVFTQNKAMNPKGNFQRWLRALPTDQPCDSKKGAKQCCMRGESADFGKLPRVVTLGKRCLAGDCLLTPKRPAPLQGKLFLPKRIERQHLPM